MRHLRDTYRDIEHGHQMIERFDDFDPQSYRGPIEHEPYYETHYGGFEEQDSQDKEHGHLVESHRSVTHVPQIKKA